MSSFNSVVLLGNLTRDIVQRQTGDGTAVATFGLATNRRYRQGDTWRDEVCYVDIVAFGRQAETCGEYLSKGDLVMIEGYLKLNSWPVQDAPLALVTQGATSHRTAHCEPGGPCLPVRAPSWLRYYGAVNPFCPGAGQAARTGESCGGSAALLRRDRPHHSSSPRVIVPLVARCPRSATLILSCK